LLATIQSITDSIPALIAYVGRDRRYVVANRLHREWLGVDAPAMVGRTLEEVLSDEVVRTIDPYVARVLAGEAVTFEMRFGAGDSQRDVQVRYVPDIREDGQVHGFVALATDVTDRTKVEADLRDQLTSSGELARVAQRERIQAQEASRQYQFLAEIIPQLVWSNGTNGEIDYVNKRWTEYTGFTLEQSRDRGWQAMLHPDDVVRTRTQWTRAMTRGELFEMTARVRRASDGMYRWFLGRSHPLKDAHGRVVGWFGTCTDIHDQKTHEDSERLLSEASRVLASSFDLSSTLPTVASMLASWFHGYCIIDLLEETGLERAAAVHMDPAKQSLLDEMRAFAPKDNRTSPLWRVVETRTAEICNEVTEQSLAATATSTRHHDVRRAIGTTGYIIAPMIAGGRVAGTIMIGAVNGDPFEPAHLRPVQELAYRCAISIGNAHAYRDAHEANRLKDEFLAIVSHELRTPLNAMRGWMSLLRGSRLGEPERIRAMEVIDRNITAQTQLVEDLLDISRMVTGSMRLHVDAVDLADVIRGAVESIGPAVAAKRLHVRMRFDIDEGPVNGDPARLQQIVWNLLSNAVKFTPAGGTIEVVLGQRDSHVEVTVSDTGQGIAPEFLPHVFERFRQGDSTTTRPVGGLGIGLAIVHHLAALHGGTVTASSEGEGRGATFVLSLPKR
jgi:PAS domain S-box-containing protein